MPKSRCLQLLEKCKNMRQLKQTHAQIITNGLGNNSYALSRIMAFCSDPQLGSLNHARRVFEQIQHPTICICNTMIRAFLLKGAFINIIEMYNQMLQDGFCPDNYTLPYVLKACIYMQDYGLGGQVHGHILKLGFLCDIYVGNTLISFYSACDGSVVDARKLFDEMPLRTAVSWTVMISGFAKQGNIDTACLLFDAAPVKDKGVWGAIISGYVQNNCFKEGLQMFRLMQSENLELDEAVFVSVLSACAHLGAMDIGIWIHRYLDQIRLPQSVKLTTALIDMYIKCGNIDLARRLFDGMWERDVICWNVMLYGLATHGDGENAFKLFMEMTNAGFKPDDITFIAIFTACSYSGMAHEGLQMFYSMTRAYGIEPKSEHYGCMVDFLGRAGMFEEAKEIIRKMPNSISSSEEAIAWRALLSACCNHGQTQLAEIAAEKLIRLEHHSGAYVLLSNMYLAAEKYDDARRIRNMMKDRGVEKAPGCSSVEVGGSVHEFIAGESTHPQMEEICKLLEKMNEQLESSGYKPSYRTCWL